jgi:hypothetical protein
VKTIQIERRPGLSKEEFNREYLKGIGKPVIVPDGIQEWPARTKWSFEYLKKTYGSDTVVVAAGLKSRILKMTKLAAYIDYLDKPYQDLPGFWLDPATGLPRAEPIEPAKSPLYLMGWHAFKHHPELFDDIQPGPRFVDDWVLILNPLMRSVFESTAEVDYWDVMIGPAGSFSKLHVDYWETHTSLAQIQGSKRCILFSPEDSEFLYEGRVNPEEPDLDRFEKFAQATLFEGIIEPGDVLFQPPGWWHTVRAREKSVTVSHSFFNQRNVNEYLSNVLRALPKLVSELEGAPEERAALGIEWKSKGFQTDSAAGDLSNKIPKYWEIFSGSPT